MTGSDTGVNETLEMVWWCHGCGHGPVPNPQVGGPGLGRCTECGDFRWAGWPKGADPMAGLTVTQTIPLQPHGPIQGQQRLGKDATCSYCGGALWVCRGVHNVC